MIASIVLAAGESRRMGSNKLLLPYGDETVIAHIVRIVLESRVEETYVVIGHDADRVSQEVSRFPVTLLRNPNYLDGMLSSVRFGLSALPEHCTGVLVALGDQPGISGKMLDALIQSFSENAKGIVVPVHEGRRGHPLLFSTRYKQEILGNYEEKGLRGLLRAHPNEVSEVRVVEAPRDMDRPEDYLQSDYWRKGHKGLEEAIGPICPMGPIGPPTADPPFILPPSPTNGWRTGTGNPDRESRRE